MCKYICTNMDTHIHVHGKQNYVGYTVNFTPLPLKLGSMSQNLIFIILSCLLLVHMGIWVLGGMIVLSSSELLPMADKTRDVGTHVVGDERLGS